MTARSRPSEWAQSVTAVEIAEEIARALARLETGLEPDRMLWAGLSIQERNRFLATARQVVLDHLHDYEQAHSTDKDPT